MANFFIDRPVFAWVLSILLMLAGALSLMQLPVAQYPTIAPPAVQITAFYPGASAKTAEETVTQVIEQDLTGLDGLRYISSQSSSSGAITITVTFNAGTDPDIAQVQVQNKVAGATAKLPEVVQRQGVVVQKSGGTFLMVLAFFSNNGTLTDTDLADFVASNLMDPISRVPGVGSVQQFGSEYAMRIWLDPNKLESFSLNPSDVTQAIASQNTQVSAGQLGAAPTVQGQQLNVTITARSLLRTPEQFEQVLLKVDANGSEVRVKDVARVELGAASYSTVSRYNGQPATGLGVTLATGANALDTMSAVQARIEQLRSVFPQSVEMAIPYDTTPFVRLSIQKVVYTLIEAVVLVFVVMFLFLQSIRATLIPTLAIPVVVLGTMAVLYALGYSINTLTMFALVLAIGLLVDDAIVVVEGVERVMEEEGLAPLEATRKSMQQLSGALVGIGMVLSAVFVPMAFFGGTTGIIYRQFSITIVTAVALSVLIALILTPTLCISLMRSGAHGPKKGFFGLFNRGFDHLTNGYVSTVGAFVKRLGRLMVIYLALSAAAFVILQRLPTSFLPDEDQGMMMGMIMLPTGATQQDTVEVLKKAESYFANNEQDSINSVFTIAGFSFAGQGANAGTFFASMKPFAERETEATSVWATMQRAQAAFFQIKEAVIYAFAPPAIIELGNATGFDFFLQDSSGKGHAALTDGQNQLLGAAAQNPAVLQGVRPNGLSDTPQFVIELDQLKSEALGVALTDVNSTISTSFGGSYVNDFIDRGRVKQVYVQGDAPYRMTPTDLDYWYVRNSQGVMVPLKSITSTRWEYGSPLLQRFNGVASLQIQGQAAPGVSSGQAMDTIEQMVAQLPENFDVAWTGISYEEREAGGQAGMLYVLSILVVFLCLAALYESWSVPFAVILVVPLGVLGAVIATYWRGIDNDVYFQVGLLTTIGLSAKNAIMIVEYAKQYFEEGSSMVDAVLHAARVRLRPILMTSLAFGFGVLPLVIATGAGSGAQNAIGTGVIGGVISATILGVLFVPLFYVFVGRLARQKRADTLEAEQAEGEKPTEHSKPEGSV